MLVITRRLNQTTNVFTEHGECIAVTIVEIRGDQVRLGISAPPSATIERAEVTRAMEGEAVLAGIPPADYCAEKRRRLAQKRLP